LVQWERIPKQEETVFSGFFLLTDPKGRLNTARGSGCERKGMSRRSKIINPSSDIIKVVGQPTLSEKGFII